MIPAFTALDEAALRAWVEAFLVERLVEADHWRSTRTSDGVSTLQVFEQTDARLHVGGVIWTIDQAQAHFVLEVTRDGHWALRFELDPTALTPRQARYVLDQLRELPGHAWRVTLTG